MRIDKIAGLTPRFKIRCCVLFLALSAAVSCSIGTKADEQPGGVRNSPVIPAPSATKEGERIAKPRNADEVVYQQLLSQIHNNYFGSGDHFLASIEPAETLAYTAKTTGAIPMDNLPNDVQTRLVGASVVSQVKELLPRYDVLAPILRCPEKIAQVDVNECLRHARSMDKSVKAAASFSWIYYSPDYHDAWVYCEYIHISGLSAKARFLAHLTLDNDNGEIVHVSAVEARQL